MVERQIGFCFSFLLATVSTTLSQGMQSSVRRQFGSVLGLRRRVCLECRVASVVDGSGGPYVQHKENHAEKARESKLA